MGRTALAPPTRSTRRAGALLGILPLWLLIAILMVSVALTAIQVIVTQVIRLRASTKITTSAHALELLTVEDTVRSTRRPRPQKSR